MNPQEDQMIVKDAQILFNPARADINKANVLAAVVTAASKMAICSDIATEAETTSQLLQTSGREEDEQVLSLLGMGPQFVRPVTGFATDFNDANAALAAYMGRKEDYDAFYSKIALLESKQNEPTITH